MVGGVPGPLGALVLRHAAEAATRHHIGVVTTRRPRETVATASDHLSMFHHALILHVRVWNHAHFNIM